MTHHIDLGKLGEELAVEYFQTRGYDVLFRNWRYERYEIDIVAVRDGKPHFIEVKSRSSEEFAYPEESVTEKKSKHIFKAANEFMYMHPEYTDLQVDILSVVFKPNGKPSFFLIEDLF